MKPAVAGVKRRRISWRWIALLLVLAPGAGRAQGVHLALLPHQRSVAPGSGFELELAVTEEGSLFNGFDAVVTYDPSALTFVPTAPTSLQQGSYITGQCGNTFHIFKAAGDSLSITEVLLCNGVLLPGPGQLYTLHFVASATPQITEVRIRSGAFFAGGINVTPVITQDATVRIEVGLAAGDPDAPRAGRLSVAPNPAFGASEIRVEAASAAAGELIVCDISGRTVRHLERGVFGPGLRTVRWDGRDDRGRRLAAGIYLVRLRAGDVIAETRLTLLD